MEAKTITCPNCGASTSNHQNCEYCGSFLVSLVEKNFNFETYKEHVQSFDTSAISKIIKQWYEVSYPKINNQDDAMEYSLAIYNKNEYNLGGEPPFQLYVDPDENYSVCLQLEDWNMGEKSYVRKAFDGTTGGGVWYAYFGTDFDGAGQFILECLSELYGYSEKAILFILNTPTESIIYNLNGEIEKSINEPMSQSVESNSTNSGCFGLFTTLIVFTLTGLGYAIYNIFA